MKCPSILVAVDGSEQSVWAAEYVVDFFSPGLAEITLFHVRSKIPEACWDLDAHPGIRQSLAGMRAWEAGRRREMEKLVEGIRQRCAQAGYSPDQLKSLMPDRKFGVARDIAIQAKQGYSALVLGRTGLSRMKDILLGSVADKLVGKLAGVPLWLVGGQPNTDRMIVALDNSPGASKALNYAAKMAMRPNIDILLLNVHRGFSIFVQEYGGELALNHVEREAGPEPAPKDPGPAMERELLKAKNRVLQSGISQDRVRTLQVRDVPSRARAIVDQAILGDFGTIVVGRRGLSRAREFFMGRVGNKVMRLAAKSAVWVVG